MARDDDLIATISDNDELPFEDEEEEEDDAEIKSSPLAPTAQKANGLKRKRKATEPEEARKKHASDTAFSTKDDGAMDSDFEFENGEFASGVIEDFDGWETNAAGGQKSGAAMTNGMVDGRPRHSSDKKGVDIDDLVERRKAKAKKSDGGVKPGSVRQGDSVDDSDEDEGPELDDEDDELLASDAFGMGAAYGEDDEGDHEDEHNAEDDSDSESSNSRASPMPHPDDLAPDKQPLDGVSTDEESDGEERARREAFFAPEPIQKPQSSTSSSSFQSMSLSRPILRGLAALNFSSPTPIQAKTVPVALMGKDVVGSAVTGSGKTAAFMIPILERLLYRPNKVPTTRVVILVPTRELAVQCYNVARKIAAFTDIQFAQIVGGFSVREQENVLRLRPDVVIATPGRFIDHMRNTAAFAVDKIEILVLDEADRMLQEGFADELDAIVSTLPRSRQTMLFSATMTSKVDDLIRAGLQRPARLMVDAQRQTVTTLTQEFVRLREGHEDKRLTYLMHLASEVYTSRAIVFFRQKKEAHRVRVVFALCGIKAAELHGSMTQEQRIAAVESFRAGTATHLLATDVASRGLDIRGVEAVINYETPQSHEIYLHRVGRTARMGKVGRACTLAAEPDRKVIKQITKTSRAQGAQIVSRRIPVDAAEAWAKKLEGLEREIGEVLAEEKEAKALAQADMQVRKADNMITHEAEIMSRPKRTWFATEKEKKMAQNAARVALNGDNVLSQKERKFKAMAQQGKLSNKAKKMMDDHKDRKEGKLFKKTKDDVKAHRAKERRGKTKPAKTGKADKSRDATRYGMKLKAGKSKKR